MTASNIIGLAAQIKQKTHNCQHILHWKKNEKHRWLQSTHPHHPPPPPGLRGRMQTTHRYCVGAAKPLRDSTSLTKTDHTQLHQKSFSGLSGDVWLVGFSEILYILGIVQINNHSQWHKVIPATAGEITAGGKSSIKWPPPTQEISLPFLYYISDKCLRKTSSIFISVVVLKLRVGGLTVEITTVKTRKEDCSIYSENALFCPSQSKYSWSTDAEASFDSPAIDFFSIDNAD